MHKPEAVRVCGRAEAQTQGAVGPARGPRAGEQTKGYGRPPEHGALQQQQQPQTQPKWQPHSQPLAQPPNNRAAGVTAATARPNSRGPSPSGHVVPPGVTGSLRVPAPRHTAQQQQRQQRTVQKAPIAEQSGGTVVSGTGRAASSAPTASAAGAGDRAPPSRKPPVTDTTATATAAAATAVVPVGEAALRARLAEAEARNAEVLARVRELEENNFDLEAAMQVLLWVQGLREGVVKWGWFETGRRGRGFE